LSYIDKNLMEGEEVIYRTKLHWFIFVRPLITFLIFMMLLGMGQPYSSLAVLVFLLVMYWSINAFIQFVSSEFALTNKRVLIKHGFVKRNSLETLLSKIEGIQVQQGILGRLFDYGTIIIIGMGGTKNPFHKIQKPMEFRKAVQEQISEM
jgi:uncharacterized membrane protein YdbT with pleckstrin-like domain